MLSKTIVLSGPAKILAIGTGVFRNNGTQSGTGGGVQIVLLNSTNAAVAFAPSTQVGVPGNGSGATQAFISQGVVGNPPGTDVTVPAGTYTLRLDFNANGICGAGAEHPVIDEGSLSYLVVDEHHSGLYGTGRGEPVRFYFATIRGHALVVAVDTPSIKVFRLATPIARQMLATMKLLG